MSRRNSAQKYCEIKRYFLLNAHYKQNFFKSVVFSILYNIRHFELFFVKRKVPTFIGTSAYGTVVCNYHFVVVQRYLFYQGVYQHLRLEFQRPLIIRSSMPSTRHGAKISLLTTKALKIIFWNLHYKRINHCIFVEKRV